MWQQLRPTCAIHLVPPAFWDEEAIARAQVHSDCHALGPVKQRVLRQVWLVKVNAAVVGCFAVGGHGVQAWCGCRGVQRDGLGAGDDAQEVVVGVVVQAGPVRDVGKMAGEAKELCSCGV
jgi:hypothetical protein